MVGDRASNQTSYYTFLYRPNDHDINAKEFSFPIYPDGNRTIPARAAACGEQDAVDFVTRWRVTRPLARRLATRLYQFFRQRDVGARSGADRRDGAGLPVEQFQHQGDMPHCSGRPSFTTRHFFHAIRGHEYVVPP